jgi:hypothetical protein
VYDPCTGSLGWNHIGASGASAIGAGLQYVPSLTTLKYVEGAGSVCGEEACACVGMYGGMGFAVRCVCGGGLDDEWECGGEGDVSMRLWQCVVLGAMCVSGVLVVGCG